MINPDRTNICPLHSSVCIKAVHLEVTCCSLNAYK